MVGTLSDIAAVFIQWRTWFLMGSQDIDMRYRRSLLGPFWISLSLVVLVIGMSALYAPIMDSRFHDYLYWLGSSFLVWFLISGLINEGMQIAIEAEGQLRSVRIPLPVLAARMVHRNFIVFLHNLIVIVAAMALFRLAPTLDLLLAPIGILVLLMIGFFCALVLGPLCLRFRDVAQVVTNVMQMAFFLTPIIWQPTQAKVPWYFVEANPFYHLIELVRAPLLGKVPTFNNWAVSLSVLAAAMVIAVLTLAMSRRKIFIWL